MTAIRIHCSEEWNTPQFSSDASNRTKECCVEESSRIVRTYCICCTPSELVKKFWSSWPRSLNWSKRSEGSCWRIWLVNWITPPGRVNLQAEWDIHFTTPYHCSESCWSRSGVWSDHQIYLIRNTSTPIVLKKYTYIDREVDGHA